MPVVSVRLSNSEHAALVRRAEEMGQSVAEFLRGQIHATSVVEAIRADTTRALEALAARLAQPTGARSAASIDAAVSASEFRVALSMIAALISTVVPADKKALATRVGERILDGVQASPESVKSAMRAAGAPTGPTPPAIKTEPLPHPATGAGAAGDAEAIKQIFMPVPVGDKRS